MAKCSFILGMTLNVAHSGQGIVKQALLVTLKRGQKHLLTWRGLDESYE